jgi:hypothetical protein
MLTLSYKLAGGQELSDEQCGFRLDADGRVGVVYDSGHVSYYGSIVGQHVNVAGDSLFEAQLTAECGVSLRKGKEVVACHPVVAIAGHDGVPHLEHPGGHMIAFSDGRDWHLTGTDGGGRLGPHLFVFEGRERVVFFKPDKGPRGRVSPLATRA